MQTTPVTKSTAALLIGVLAIIGCGGPGSEANEDDGSTGSDPTSSPGVTMAASTTSSMSTSPTTSSDDDGDDTTGPGCDAIPPPAECLEACAAPRVDDELIAYDYIPGDQFQSVGKFTKLAITQNDEAVVSSNSGTHRIHADGTVFDLGLPTSHGADAFVDPAGALHLVVGDAGVLTIRTLADPSTEDISGWTSTVIDDAFQGRVLRAEATANGGVQIVVHRQTQTTGTIVAYRQQDTAVWEQAVLVDTSRIQSTASVGGPTGDLAILYVLDDDNDVIWLATATDDIWVSAPVPVPITAASLDDRSARFADGFVHALVYGEGANGRQLYHLQQNTDAWDVSHVPIPETIVIDSAIAIATDGTVHVLAAGHASAGNTVDNVPGTPAGFHHARRGGGGSDWIVSEVGSTHIGASGLGLAVDSEGHVHAAFHYTQEYAIAFYSDHIRYLTTRGFCID